MDEETRADKARRLVFEYIKKRLEKTDKHVTFSLDEVYVVSFHYVLGHWKAMVSTTLPDGMYYEVTYHASRNVTFIDAYKKWDNVEVPDPGSLAAVVEKLRGQVQGDQIGNNSVQTNTGG
jgi:hypothetical protein